MSNYISLGERITITFPTFLYFFSLIVRYYLKTSTEREYREHTDITKRLTIDFFQDIYLESMFLTIGNGLILVFTLGITEWGILLNFLIAPLLVLLGFITLKSPSGRTFVAFFLFILFLSELIFFFTYGLVFEVLGFTLLPEHIAWIPLIFVFILLIATGLYQKKKKILSDLKRIDRFE